MINHRHCTNPVDLIAGLFHVFEDDLPDYPVYRPSDSEEQAWVALVSLLTNSARWVLSYEIPQPPNQLFPTWGGLVKSVQMCRSTPMPPDHNALEHPLVQTIAPLVGPMGFPVAIEKIAKVRHTGIEIAGVVEDWDRAMEREYLGILVHAPQYESKAMQVDRYQPLHPLARPRP